MKQSPQKINRELVRTASNAPLWRTLSTLSQPSARALLPESLAYKFSVLPMAIIRTSSDESVLSVISATEELPFNELRFATGCRLVNEVAPKNMVERAIVSAYLNDRELSHVEPKELFQLILKKAVAQDSSDIHLEPASDSKHLVKLRVDGYFGEPIIELESELASKLVRYLKAKANLDLTVHDLPQESVFSEKIGNLRLRLRLSILPTGLGKSVVIRIHQLNEVSSFEGLGLDTQQISLLQQSLLSNSGMILLSGPTGSGKSTLLYACLDFLAKKNKKIISVEDPIEQLVSHTTQVEVNKAGKRGFIDYLPAVLRQDPEVLMIGEIRESRTAKLAFEASLTGHLVLTSLHGSSIREILLRLKSLGLNYEECIASFRLVCTQRLVARNCHHCRVVESSLYSIRQFFSLSRDELVYHSKGCRFCKQTGVNGRIGVYEIKSFLGEDPLLNRSYYPIFHSLKSLLLKGEISAGTAMAALGLELTAASQKT